MSRSIPVILGMDGGGTATTAWLADLDGNVLGQGRGGSSNIKAVGEIAARAALEAAVDAAFGDAGIDPMPIEVSCLGLAGFDRAEDKDWLRRWAAGTRWARKLVLVNDGDLVVAAGTPQGWGVGIISGTGSIAVGRSPDGTTARSGGWGYILGDEGSGYAVAVHALRRICRREDGRDGRDTRHHDHLTLRICGALGIEGPHQLVSRVYGAEMTRAMIAGLAAEVAAAADSDPSIVAEILEPAGAELAKAVLAVARKLDFPKGILPVALAGSFLLGCSHVSRVLINRVTEAGYQVRPTPVPHPVEGALILARRELKA